MSEDFFSPDDVAGTLNIPLSTLELWCALFGSCLSASARPSDLPGTEVIERRFTEEDVVVLAGAKQLMARQVTSSVTHGSQVG